MHELDKALEKKDRREEDDTEEEGDLDIVRTTAKKVNLLQALEETSSDKASSSGSEDGSNTHHRSKRRRHGLSDGERIAFSDDEDAGAVYEKYRHRKSNARRKTAARTRKAKKAAAPDSSIVGRKSIKELTIMRDDPPVGRAKTDPYGSDSDIDTPETALPAFLRERRSRWKTYQNKVGEAGLDQPPDYKGIDFSDDERLQELKERPDLVGVTPKSPYQDVQMRFSDGVVPAPIAQWLRDYQVKGAEFLHEQFVWQKGGLLGDDMGLGKTIQVIAFLTAAFGKTGDERDEKRMRKMRRARRWYPKVLIVCPGGLMDNWESEIKKWGWWHVDRYHGGRAGQETTLNAAKAGRLEIMITTYSTYRINKDSINMVEWDCVVADECHLIKERKSEITKAMSEVNALCRIGLTGTAVQNKYDEMWTILNWANPGCIGPLSAWKATISNPLKLGQSHDATVAQLAKAREIAEKLRANLLPNFFLRRLKSLIADQLPKKSDRIVFCPLTDDQAAAYENLIDSELVQYIRTSSEPCDCESGKKRGWCCYAEIPGRGRWQNFVFPTIMYLQRLANHLAMIIPSTQDKPEKQEKDAEILQMAMPEKWKDLYRTRDSITNYANQAYCGKWRVLKKLLRFWYQSGDKVLVFSHSVRLLKMLAMLFKSTTSYNVSYLDGSMSYDDRAKAVDDFNANPSQFVFLISTKAGGVGLNITSANKVVVFDPNWNPAWDLQAQDRAYRIGQTRDVEVFRLVSAGTMEEIVYARQVYKQQQANIAYHASVERRYFRGVQDQKDKKGEIFGLVNLFSYQGNGVVLRDIVNKTNIAESKAGVSVIGLDNTQVDDGNSDFDSDDDDLPIEANVGKGELAAMNRLAAVITEAESAQGRRKALGKKGKKRQIDAVQAILSGAGVEYTHENSEVIGGSKMETKLSKRAERAGNDLDIGNQSVFVHSQSQIGDKGEAASSAAKRLRTSSRGDISDGDDGNNAPMEDCDGEEDLGTVRYRWHPPDQVRRRQFCSMAKFAGYVNDVAVLDGEGAQEEREQGSKGGATEFALVVEGWTQAQRRDFLDRFYKHRRRVLAGD